MYIGVDVGGTKILVGLIDEYGKVLVREKLKTLPEEGPDIILEKMMTAIDIVAKQSLEPIKAIGIGVPGAIDKKNGIVIFSPNLKWKNILLRDRLHQRFTVPIFLENDVNVGMLGEWWQGAGKTYQNGIGLFVGTGIGGAIMVNGELLQGLHGIAGELGHITLVLDGPECNCGKKGCLEAMASKTAMTRQLREAGMILPDGIVRSSFLAKAYHENKHVRNVIKSAAMYLGAAIGNLANFLDPEIFIIGGGIAQALGTQMIEKIKEKANEVAFIKPTIVLAALGDDSGIVGAAHTAMITA